VTWKRAGRGASLDTAKTPEGTRLIQHRTPETNNRSLWTTVLVSALCAASVLAAFIALVAIIDTSAINRVLNTDHIPAVLVFLLLSGGARLLLAARLWSIVRRWMPHIRFTLWSAIHVTFLAEFASLAFTTAITGEAVRIWKLRAAGASIGHSVLVVTFDRVVGSFVILTTGLPMLTIAAIGVANVLLRHPTATSAAALAAVLALIAIGYGIRRFGIADVQTRIREILSHWPMALAAAALSLASLAFALAANAYVLWALAGTTLPVAAVITLGSRVGRLVPLAVAGVGPGEALIVALGGFMNVPLDVTLFLVALTLAGKYVFGTIGALTEMAIHGQTFSTLRHSNLAQTPETEE